MRLTLPNRAMMTWVVVPGGELHPVSPVGVQHNMCQRLDLRVQHPITLAGLREEAMTPFTLAPWRCI